MGWLVVAAAALVLFAGLCASADTALLRVSRAGAKELASSADDPSPPLQAVLAEVPKYIAVLLLARVAAEITATLFVAFAFEHWFVPPWRGLLYAGLVMTAAVYLVDGIVPRTLSEPPMSAVRPLPIRSVSRAANRIASAAPMPVGATSSPVTTGS